MAKGVRRLAPVVAALAKGKRYQFAGDPMDSSISVYCYSPAERALVIETLAAVGYHFEDSLGCFVRETGERSHGRRSWMAHCTDWEPCTLIKNLEVATLAVRGATAADRKLAGWIMRRADRMTRRYAMDVHAAGWQVLAAFASKRSQVTIVRTRKRRRKG